MYFLGVVLVWIPGSRSFTSFRMTSISVQDDKYSLGITDENGNGNSGFPSGMTDKKGNDNCKSRGNCNYKAEATATATARSVLSRIDPI